MKTDPLLDPWRDEARFKKIERELQFPSSDAPIHRNRAIVVGVDVKRPALLGKTDLGPLSPAELSREYAQVSLPFKATVRACTPVALRRSCAVLSPAAVGLNATCTRHDAPTASVLAQCEVNAN